MSAVDFTRPGVWAELFPQDACSDKPSGVRHQRPTVDVRRRDCAHAALGASTQQRHRPFVPDPQYLGFVNTCLSDVAEGISRDYEEAAEYIKLVLPKARSSERP